MSQYYHLLEEHVQLLQSKGYDEKSLNSPDKDGWLFTELKRNLSDALHQAWQEGEAVSFTIRTTGFFNEDQDMIHFKLHYLFDLEKSSLILTGLELSADNVTRKIELKSIKDLPNSSIAALLLNQQIYNNRKRTNAMRTYGNPNSDRRIK